MWRAIVVVLALLLTIGLSAAQTNAPFPSSTSGTQATLGFGQMVLQLDQPSGFKVGQVVQVTAQTDGQFAIGTIVAYDPVLFFATINIIVPNTQANIYYSFLITVVGTSGINSTPVWAGLSIDQATSLTYPTTAGTTISLTVEPGKVFSNFSTVYVWSPQDITTWAIGTVVTYDPVGGAITIFVKQASTTGLTYSINYVTMVDTAAIDADLTNYSSTPYNGAGSTTVTTPSKLKMTVSLPGSLTGGGTVQQGGSSPTLVAGSVFPFTVVAGQYFPIQGNVLLDDLTPGTTHNHYIGNVYSYTGTTLNLLIQSVFGTGSPSQAWGMYLIAGPPQVNAVLYQMTGLLVTGSAFGFTVQPGSVQDTTGTTTLTLTASETATLVGKQVTGTASSVAGILSGSSTTFTTDFSATGKLTDLNNQLANLNAPSVTAGVILGTNQNAIMAPVISVASNTSLTLNVGNNFSSGNIYRGFAPNAAISGFPQTWAVIIARQDSTGNCHTFQVSFTPSGVPDLPSGYTAYRVIAYSTMGGPGSIVNIIQPLLASRDPRSPKGVFAATITPTAVGITVASVNTSTGLITMNNGSLGGVPVVTGNSVELTGAVPTGLTTGTTYYINVQSPGDLTHGATFFLYTTLAGAYAGGSTAKVIPSGTTTGWSFRYFAYTNVYSAGFDANAPIGGTPGSANMAFDLNLQASLSGAAGLTACGFNNLYKAGAGLRDAWFPASPSATYTSTTLVQLPNANIFDAAANNPGTWANQATSGLVINCTVTGALDDPIPANDNDLLERAVA